MAKKSSIDRKELTAIILMVGLFVIIHGLALLITAPFEAAGMEAFENPDDPKNLIFFFVIILIMTAIILLIAKFWKKHIIKILILGAVGYTSFYVFIPLLSLFFIDILTIILAIFLAAILIFVLYRYPEWYIIDITGIIVGAGAIAIFGISLGITLVIILLIGLAIYDAISVYKTKHMIDLADTVMDLKLPVLLVIPKIKHYSLIKETKRLKEHLDEETERDAFFLGLGDVVMPGILVIAVYQNIEQGLPIAIATLLGTLLGFILLMTFVLKGKPQAGLPCLCGGAILGYLLSSYLYFGTIVGLNLSF